MRTILDTAHGYMILGLVNGLYCRELTKVTGFTGETQLGVVHTHAARTAAGARRRDGVADSSRDERPETGQFSRN